MCCNLQPFLKAIDVIVTILKIALPIILIVLGTVDMFKAITANDEKVVAEARRSLIKRVIYAVLIFLVPYFVELILEFTERNFLQENNSGLENPTSWISCWNGTMKETLDCSSCEDIYDDDSDTNNSSTGNSGDNNDQDLSLKYCYWWEVATCDKTTLLSHHGVDSNAFSRYSGINKVIFKNKAPYCEFNITPVNDNDGYACSSMCNALGGEIFDSSNCSCRVKAIVEEKYSTILPKSALSGNVTVYQIPNTSKCSNAPDLYSSMGSTSVKDQADS